jgi:hypothetical protein
MDQQGNGGSPAQGVIWDATVHQLATATELSMPNPPIYTSNPWMQLQQNPNFWNQLSLFLPLFQQVGLQLPMAVAAPQMPAAPEFWPGTAPLQSQESSLQNPSYLTPASQSLGMFQGIPLLAPVQAEQPIAAGGGPAADFHAPKVLLPSATSPTLLTPTKLDAPQRTARKKRARILREGQLTMIVYGANEALTWARLTGSSISECYEKCSRRSKKDIHVVRFSY